MRQKFFRVLCVLWLFFKNAFYSTVFAYVLISLCMLIERWCYVSPGIIIGILLAAAILWFIKVFYNWPDTMMKAQRASLMSNQQIKDRIVLYLIVVVLFGVFLLFCDLLYRCYLAL